MNNDRFKFRVFDNERGEYVRNSHYDRFFCIQWDGRLWETEYREPNDSSMTADASRYIVEQCTGLRDRNDELIYEGDVLENTPAGWTFHVIWNGAAWFAESDEPPLLERLNIMPLGICKVVGNIHEGIR